MRIKLRKTIYQIDINFLLILEKKLKFIEISYDS